MTLIPVYFTYSRYQNLTANVSQIIWILIQHLPHGYRHLVNELRVTWLKLLGLIFFRSQKMTALSREQTVLVKKRSWKSGSMPECSLTKLAPGSQFTPPRFRVGTKDYCLTPLFPRTNHVFCSVCKLARISSMQYSYQNRKGRRRNGVLAWPTTFKQLLRSMRQKRTLLSVLWMQTFGKRRLGVAAEPIGGSPETLKRRRQD